MSKNKIEWCHTTWNPVWGCTFGCRYCYARKVAKRFARPIAALELAKGTTVDEEALANFKPTFLMNNFLRKFKKSEQVIFVNSMSDIADWKPEWITKVLEKAWDYWWCDFLFLTKRPEIYLQYTFPSNCWQGYTAIGQTTLDKGTEIMSKVHGKKFLSLEPLLNPVHQLPDWPDWIIVGGITGSQNTPMVPQWAINIAHWCEGKKIPFFFKSWGSGHPKTLPLLSRQSPFYFLDNPFKKHKT